MYLFYKLSTIITIKNIMKINIFKPLLAFAVSCFGINMPIVAQFYTEADSLRGTLSPLRSCYDVKHYDLNVDIDFNNQYIKGYNQISYQTIIGFNMLQLDLFAGMKVDSIVHKNKQLLFNRKHNAVFVDFGSMQEAGILDTIKAYFSGNPRVAVNAPWDGGFSWSKDSKGRNWLGVSCEGLGASVWWVNKDHLSDEPDSMRIVSTVPKEYMSVSNGQLRSTKKTKKKMTYEWVVTYPINNYNVTLNVGHYVHFSDTFVYTDKEKLPLDYYVLDYNIDKAKKQFLEVASTLTVMEKYLNKYPFANDGYGLVETPYLGMEHQGAIAYGNNYMKGYRGMYPNGIPFDYIIMHETAHEWWGNSVSCNDHAELWIHETFTTYMEAVYTEEIYGYKNAERYLKQQFDYMSNTQPMIGAKGVNYNKHNSDIYYKGSLMLHTLRNSINNDSLWWATIKGFYNKYTIKNANTEDFINYVNEITQQDYSLFFELYLYKSKLPTLQYKIKTKNNQTEISLKFKSEVEKLSFGVKVETAEGNQHIIVNDSEWTSFIFNTSTVAGVKIALGLYNTEKIN
jgi:aminopeptidase N